MDVARFKRSLKLNKKLPKGDLKLGHHTMSQKHQQLRCTDQEGQEDQVPSDLEGG